jgi:hypothetical protein
MTKPTSEQVTFLAAGSGATQRTVLDKLRDVVSVKDFGAVGDGTADDTAAIQAAYDYAVGSVNGRGILMFGPGIFRVTSTINLHTRGIAIVGVESGRRQSGSTPATCAIRWFGGAAPVFQTSVSQFSFVGFGVENWGTATDWLELNSGAINNHYEELYFYVPTGAAQFSRSVIRSNGNRVGYSQFSRINSYSAAPIFLDIDGQGTSNSITPIHFGNRCIFGAVAGLDYTIIKITDESIENVEIRNCSFNQEDAELTIIDTTSSPLTATIRTMTFENNEIDILALQTATWRQFKLENVQNINFNGNTMAGGGTQTAIADLTNSNVTSCSGNDYYSLPGPIFSADSASKIIVGVNRRTDNSTRPEFTQAECGFVQIPYVATMVVDGKLMGGTKHGIYRIDVTNGSGYTIRAPVAPITGPEHLVPGQMFTVIIRNVSGGVISAGTFDSSRFNLSGASVAPADGFNRAYTFYYDGTKCIEISRSAADVANA